MKTGVLRLLSSLAVVLLLALAACGGDDGGEPTPSAESPSDDGSGEPTATSDGGDIVSVDVCSLISDEQAEDILGSPAESNDESIDQFGACAWNGDSFDTFTVTVYHGSRESVEAYFELANEDSDVVEGIGENAYWDPVIGTFEVLYDTYAIDVNVFVSSVMGDEGERLELSKDVAEIVLAGLD